MKKNTSAIGILGGTFNPIHKGHIAIAEHVLQSCHLSRIDFIPCFQPPHRNDLIALPEHRLAMLKLAIKYHAKLYANDYEIQQKKISYTINTVAHLRKQNPTQPFCLIVGSDAFAHFEEWRDWEKIINTVNLIVVSRTQDAIKSAHAVTAALKQTHNTQDLCHALSGYVYFDKINPIAISATKIRHDILTGKKEIAELNPAVHDYILKHQVY